MLGERTLDIGLPKNMELGVREALDGWLKHLYWLSGELGPDSLCLKTVNVDLLGKRTLDNGWPDKWPDKKVLDVGLKNESYSMLAYVTKECLILAHLLSGREVFSCNNLLQVGKLVRSMNKTRKTT